MRICYNREVKNAIIIHGWGADSTSNWFPWLADELRKKDFEVTVPDFPNTLEPQLNEWLGVLSKQKLENTILIGHSLGTPFIFRLLEKFATENLEHMSGGEMIKPVYTNRVKAAFLVSSFDRTLGIPELDNFVDQPFNWQKIKNACEKFCVFHSDNDPYIPLWIGEEIAKKINAELIVEKDGEHLNAVGGFLEYPKLLEKILSM